MNFCSQKLKSRILAIFGFNRMALRAAQPKLYSKITLSAAELMSFGSLGAVGYLWHAVKNKCYADKPETIDALKDNIREVIGEIQLHTNDNVLKNWTDHVGYCMASQVSHLN